MKRTIIAAAALLASIGSAGAQDDEIIVTGSRISAYERDFVPVVHLKRRADFLLTTITVESDSRDGELRRSEVLKTLSALADRAAKDASVELAVKRTFEFEDDEIVYVEPLTTKALAADILTGGSRSDTTKAELIVKTAIRPEDTLETAFGRLEKFAQSASKTGRALVYADNEPGLSVVDLDRYRAPLLAAIAADAAALKSALGPDYGISLAGFEQPVRWRVVGPLELALYFPYSSAAAPR